MRDANKQKGITLIALVITIIILLILAGISIVALTNTGLFESAQQAKQETENAQTEENETLNEYEQWLENYTGSSSESETTETLASKVQPGDYVSYTPDEAGTTEILSELSAYSGNTDSTKNTESTLTQENLNWRVLDVVDGKVRLISEVPTTSTVALEGYKGYNNAVYLLDRTCRTLYNNSTYTDNVQNLKIEDIEKYMETTDYSTINSSYGTTFSPTHKYYPSIFAQEAEQTVNEITGTLGLSEQTAPINQTTANTATSMTVKYTYWNKSMEKRDFTNQIYYNLFINNGSNYSTYWMSSRCVAAISDSAYFSVCRVYSGRVSAYNLYYSNDTPSYNAFALRPVITLKSNILVKSGSGTPDLPYEIGVIEKN